MNANPLGGRLLENRMTKVSLPDYLTKVSLPDYLLLKEGKGTSKWRNLADEAFLNQVIKLTSDVSWSEYRRLTTSQLVFLPKLLA